MRIKYKNTREDIYNYFLYKDRNSKKIKKISISISSIAIIFSILLINLLAIKYSLSLKTKVILVLCISIILFLEQFIAIRLNRKKRAEYAFNEVYLDDEVEVDIKNDYVLIKNCDVELKIEFLDKPKLLKNKQCYYFIIDNKNALIIPNHIFATEEDKKLFEKEVNSILNT